MSKSDNAEIAVLQTQMEEQTKILQETSQDVKNLSLKMDNFSQSFLSRAEFEEYKKGNWARHTLSAVAGAAITAIITAVVYWVLRVNKA